MRHGRRLRRWTQHLFLGGAVVASTSTAVWSQQSWLRAEPNESSGRSRPSYRATDLTRPFSDRFAAPSHRTQIPLISGIDRLPPVHNQPSLGAAAEVPQRGTHSAATPSQSAEQQEWGSGVSGSAANTPINLVDVVPSSSPAASRQATTARSIHSGSSPQSSLLPHRHVVTDPLSVGRSSVSISEQLEATRQLLEHGRDGLDPNNDWLSQSRLEKELAQWQAAPRQRHYVPGSSRPLLKLRTAAPRFRVEPWNPQLVQANPFFPSLDPTGLVDGKPVSLKSHPPVAAQADAEGAASHSSAADPATQSQGLLNQKTSRGAGEARPPSTPQSSPASNGPGPVLNPPGLHDHPTTGGPSNGQEASIPSVGNRESGNRPGAASRVAYRPSLPERIKEEPAARSQSSRLDFLPIPYLPDRWERLPEQPPASSAPESSPFRTDQDQHESAAGTLAPPALPIEALRPLAVASTPDKQTAWQLAMKQANLLNRVGFELAERGECDAARQRFMEALQHLSQAKDEIEGRAGSAACLTQGLAQPDNSDRETSPWIERWVGACGANPVSSAAFLGLGKILAMKQGGAKSENSKAEVLFRAALSADPNNYLAANELGVQLAQASRYQAARDAFIQSLRVCPEAAAWRNLSNIHEELGESELADLARNELLLLQQRGSSQGVTQVRWLTPSEYRRTGSAHEQVNP